MRGDVRLAARMMLRAKGWTAVVLASLALGIGAGTTLLGALDALLLRKLAVRDPDSLVRLRSVGPNEMRTDTLVYGFTAPDDRGRHVDPTFSYPMYRLLAEHNRTLSALFACAPIGDVNVVVDGQARIASAFLASGNFHRVLGVTARLGRTIVPDDDRATAAPVAVISDRYWRSRFGGDEGVVGRPARVNNAPVTIVGVLPPGFTGVQRPLEEAPDVTMPMALEPMVMLQPSGIQGSLLAAPNFWWVQVLGRVKPGVTAAQVRGDLAGLFRSAAREDFASFLSKRTPEERSQFTPQDPSAVPDLLVESGSRGVYDADGGQLRALRLLAGIVALVLLIVCANVANLLLARTTARQSELAIRLALGASRAALVRQLLVETLLLSGIGGVLALVLARWMQSVVRQVIGHASPLDWRVLAFGVAISTITGLLAAVVPALRVTRRDLASAVGRTSRTRTRVGTRLGKSLVVGQVTISLVLLVAAFLLLRTVENLRRVDLGFDPRNVLLFRVSPALNGYEPERRNPLYVEIASRLAAVPGVRSVSWSNPPLMSAGRFSSEIWVQGRTYPQSRGDAVSGLVVSPSFFATMQIPIQAGRPFTDRDTKDAPMVAIVNERAARMYFPNVSPIGRRFGLTPEDSSRIEVVGIVRDARYNDLREPAPPTVYTPYLQSYSGSMTFEVRTAADPRNAIRAVREAVRTADPNLPIIDMTTQLQQVESRLGQERTFAEASTLLAGLAVVLASIGLFGLMSYSVAGRTNEIGIRMALGAARRDVLRLVIRESMILVAAGVLLGLAAAASASRLLAHLLFGVPPGDGRARAGAVAVTLVVSAVAAYLPARRAARVDPVIALREE